jgi:acyl carrier protein phosphodiesterase
MNFLAHLWLADRADAHLAGAVLGDLVRGRVLDDWPEQVAYSIRLHRAIDAATDRHPLIVAARGDFVPGQRRYAGIVLDMVCDHLLSLQWAELNAEPLPRFTRRMSESIAADAALFTQAGANAPEVTRFDALLRGYARADGIDQALRRISARLRKPEGLLVAARDWQQHAERLAPALPTLLDDLSRVTPDR